MSKGFIFNSGKCVNCKACSAACTIENGWSVKARQVYSWNADALPGLPVFNYSFACNHCENPACMKACPADCYSRDKVTGAILIDQEKCLGCKYCAWNCPYKAPRFNSQKRVIEKCNLCYNAVSSGEMPACVNACPSGALGFGELTPGSAPGWFPVQKLNPGISFIDYPDRKTRIIPVNKFHDAPAKKDAMRWKSSDTSLVVFTFLITALASIMAASVLKGTFPGRYTVVILPLIAALASLFHLGKPFRSWKSLLNVRSSPLSREILFFIIFSVFSLGAVYLEMPALLISAAISGLILLILIDNVYNHVCSSSWFHSGQTFLTSLLLISYLSAALIPFTFIAGIKLSLSLSLLIKKKEVFYAIRYLRIVILLLVWTGFITGMKIQDSGMFALLLIGELADRGLFYIDFEPENISRLLSKNLIRHINEEKRG